MGFEGFQMRPLDPFDQNKAKDLEMGTLVLCLCCCLKTLKWVEIESKALR